MVKQITVAESQQMVALLTGVEKFFISHCLQPDTRNPLSKRSVRTRGVETSRNKFDVSTCDLVCCQAGFSCKGNSVYNQGFISRTVCAILNPHEFLGTCQLLEPNVSNAASSCDRLYTRRVQPNSEEQIRKLKQILADLQAPILQIDSRVAALFERLDRSELLSILEWISDIPYGDIHSSASTGQTCGTGEWLLRHEKYCEWRASTASMILWLQGDRECRFLSVLRRVVLIKSDSWGRQNEVSFHCRR